jgi:hypothetical protein
MEENNQRHLSINIRTIRRDITGASLKEMSDRTGIPQSVHRKYERGDAIPGHCPIKCVSIASK